MAPYKHLLECIYCQRKDFRTERGLTQHQNQKHPNKDSRNLGCLPKLMPLPLKLKAALTEALVNKVVLTPCHPTLPFGLTQVCQSAQANSGNTARDDTMVVEEFQFQLSLDDADEAMADVQEDCVLENNNPQELVDNATNIVKVDTSLRDKFLTYMNNSAWRTRMFVDVTGGSSTFHPSLARAIRLMTMLRQRKTSLDTYENAMEWHLRELGCIRPTESVYQCPDYWDRRRLFKHLRERYDQRGDLWNQTCMITLPHSQETAKIVRRDAKEMMISLLTDPRINDEDYLFFDEDPLKPPPRSRSYIEDMNSGNAYRRTYKKLIKDPSRQVLLPVIFYIDGANTGQFNDLPITAVKFSLGIFKRKAREKDYCWRTLGYIPAVSKFKTKGTQIVLNSGHMDTELMKATRLLPNSGTTADKQVHHAQDFHSMLDVVLKSYIELQNSGFTWDLRYKRQLYKNIEFVLFTPFLKVDGEEGDKLCGKYLNRNKGVSQLCRYCECPTDDSDDPLADFPLKTKRKIEALMKANDIAGLKKLSQHNIQNALYALRFGLHNRQGVHGACPVEMLHALLLGIFRYTRDCFFAQIGESTPLAEAINGLCMAYGKMMARQSDRDFPKTVFGNGIARGKLMAQEYPGILLCIAVVLRSTKGKELLQGTSNLKNKADTKKKRKANNRQKKTTRKNFSNTEVRDWSILVETLLQWERWLKSSRLPKLHVEEAEEKHRYIMYLMKKVARRQKGMALKLTKFHQIVHMSEDILNFGVPLEVDTGCNESGHKKTKVAALVTQRKESTFDEQTSLRLDEMHLLDLATCELEGRPLWKYGQHVSNNANDEKAQKGNTTGGSGFLVYVDEITRKAVVDYDNKSNNTEKGADLNIFLEDDLVSFLANLWCHNHRHSQAPIRLHTLHIRRGVKFRGHPNYKDSVWRDWAMFHWGSEGEIPCKIYGFLDFRNMRPAWRIRYGGTTIRQLVYAVVEKGRLTPENSDANHSEMFRSITKDVRSINSDGKVTGFHFHLADVETITQAISVVPHIGGPPNSYFLIKNRDDWVYDFEEFLEMDMDLEKTVTDVSDSDEDEHEGDVNEQEDNDLDDSELDLSDVE